MMGRYLSPQESNEGFCAGVPDTRQDFGGSGGGGHTCPVPYQMDHMHCIVAGKATAGVF